MFSILSCCMSTFRVPTHSDRQHAVKFPSHDTTPTNQHSTPSAMFLDTVLTSISLCFCGRSREHPRTPSLKWSPVIWLVKTLSLQTRYISFYSHVQSCVLIQKFLPKGQWLSTKCHKRNVVLPRSWRCEDAAEIQRTYLKRETKQRIELINSSRLIIRHIKITTVTTTIIIANMLQNILTNSPM